MSDSIEPNVINLAEHAKVFRAQIRSATVARGGGGPHNPDMEARLAAVEADTREIKGILQRLEPLLGRMDERMRKVEVDVAELKGRVSQLPTTIQVIGFVIAVLVAGGVLRYFAG